MSVVVYLISFVLGYNLFRIYLAESTRTLFNKENKGKIAIVGVTEEQRHSFFWCYSALLTYAIMLDKSSFISLDSLDIILLVTAYIILIYNLIKAIYFIGCIVSLRLERRN